MNDILKALNSPVGWLGALAIAILLLAGTAEGPTDHEFAQDQADDMETYLHEAQQLCLAARGPNAETMFLPDGSLVCRAAQPVRQAVL
ncbi:MAG: hypothetical protein EOO23_06560 [Comamonadaceae bacterium]|nr:MAG: hypothetical protein EOO23_06560 [Comamonadaceae bacterium]